MPENLPSMILFSLFVGIGLLALIRVIALRCTPTKTVPATLVDKQTIDVFSKYSGNGKQKKYVVIFSAEGRKRSFYVSQFSYDGYCIGEKGKLTYQGNKLISFK